jgi:hypothetical protein
MPILGRQALSAQIPGRSLNLALRVDSHWGTGLARSCLVKSFSFSFRHDVLSIFNIPCRRRRMKSFEITRREQNKCQYVLVEEVCLRCTHGSGDEAQG